MFKCIFEFKLWADCNEKGGMDNVNPVNQFPDYYQSLTRLGLAREMLTTWMKKK